MKKEISKIILILVIVLLIADATMTFIAVKKFKIAEEFNPCNNLAWELFGYPIGETLRLSVAFFCMAYLYRRTKKQNPLFALGLMILVLSAVLFVVYNNATILIDYFAVR